MVMSLTMGLTLISWASLLAIGPVTSNLSYTNPGPQPSTTQKSPGTSSVPSPQSPPAQTSGSTHLPGMIETWTFSNPLGSAFNGIGQFPIVPYTVIQNQQSTSGGSVGATSTATSTSPSPQGSEGLGGVAAQSPPSIAQDVQEPLDNIQNTKYGQQGRKTSQTDHY
jgi:hypothetical protein